MTAEHRTDECERVRLADPTAGRSTGEDASVVQAHLARCPACRAWCADMASVDAALAGALAPGDADRPAARQVGGVMQLIEATGRDQRGQRVDPDVASVGVGDGRGSGWLSWRWLGGGALALLVAVMILVVVPFGRWQGRDGGRSPGEDGGGPDQADHTVMGVLCQLPYTLSPDPGTMLVRETAPGGARETIGRLEAGVSYRLTGDRGGCRIDAGAGNTIDVAVGSRFTPRMDGVTLDEGSASFDLPKIPAGYTVRTPHGSVEVVGTRFDVVVAAAGTLVRLHRGRVRIRSPREESFLDQPGQRMITHGGAVTRVEGPAAPDLPDPSPDRQGAGSDGAPSGAQQLEQGF